MYRSEWKYLLSVKEAETLKQRFKKFLEYDRHAGPDGYEIRSLYFDDVHESAYNEKLMGVYDRKKWRIRIYDYSDKKIALERKKKKGNYIYKQSVDLTKDEFYQIINGNFWFLQDKEDNLFKEFYVECISNVLRPKVIVDYKRLPFVMEAGTVRLTFDENIRAAVGSFDIFDKSIPTVPAQEEGFTLLEVKYTEFLPMAVKNVLHVKKGDFSAFSKYTNCFEAANGAKYGKTTT